MAYATPPPTIYDIANLQLTQSWADPLLRAQELKRQEAAIAQQQEFQRQQQQDMLSGYTERDRMRLEAAAVEKDGERRRLQEAAVKTYGSIAQRRKALTPRMLAAVQAVESDLRNRIEVQARNMAQAELGSEKLDTSRNPEHESLLESKRAILSDPKTGLQPNPILSVQAANLQMEVDELRQRSSRLLDDAVRYGYDISPMMMEMEDAGFSGLSQDDAPLPKTKKDGTASGTVNGTAKERGTTQSNSGQPEKRQDTQGYIRNAWRYGKKRFESFNDYLQKAMQPVAKNLHNYATDAIGGNYIRDDRPPVPPKTASTPSIDDIRALVMEEPRRNIVRFEAPPAMLQIGPHGPEVASELTPPPVFNPFQQGFYPLSAPPPPRPDAFDPVTINPMDSIAPPISSTELFRALQSQMPPPRGGVYFRAP